MQCVYVKNVCCFYVLSVASICMICFLLGSVIGSEDCLFLDITIPHGVLSANKKPVMVWFYGGAYIAGFKDVFLGATLAKHGDVIVVTVNYRLGVLGFLSDGIGKS